jgi:anti-sigma regulatory factor (Ser/Thr protein kinase)
MKLIAEHRLRTDDPGPRPVGDWVASFAAAGGLSPVVRNAFDLSLEEWVTNVISYGYEDRTPHWITLRFFVDGTSARVEVEDDGRPFDPLSCPPVDIAASLDERGIGGLGIHLIRRLMDSVEHRRVDGRNLLVLTKLRGS